MFRSYIHPVNDFPKKDVVYWDFTPLLADPLIREKALSHFLHHFHSDSFTHIAAIESKGFIWGSLLAHEMNLPLCLIRKPWLTPGPVFSQRFDKEYGTGTYEIARHALQSGNRVLLVYDILAGPGATLAAVKLIQQAGATTVGCAYVVELGYLPGREQLNGLNIFSLVKIEEQDSHDV